MPRPRVRINWTEFDKLCAIQCTVKEICLWFRCSDDALASAVKREKKLTLKVYMDQMAAQGTVSLRRALFQGALKGDRQLMIWLSKQYLKMAEKTETKLTGSVQTESPQTIDQIQAELTKIREMRLAIEGGPAAQAGADAGEKAPSGSSSN